MEEIEYLHWEDYYKDTWLNAYNQILADKEDRTLNTDDIYNKFVSFYESTVFLILTYLRNNGYYYNNNLAILKAAFRADFIEDGDSFVAINDMVVNIENYNKEEVLKYSLYDNFHVFESIDKKFRGFLEQE